MAIRGDYYSHSAPASTHNSEPTTPTTEEKENADKALSRLHQLHEAYRTADYLQGVKKHLLKKIEKHAVKFFKENAELNRKIDMMEKKTATKFEE